MKQPKATPRWIAEERYRGIWEITDGEHVVARDLPEDVARLWAAAHETAAERDELKAQNAAFRAEQLQEEPSPWEADGRAMLRLCRGVAHNQTAADYFNKIREEEKIALRARRGTDGTEKRQSQTIAECPVCGRTLIGGTLQIGGGSDGSTWCNCLKGDEHGS